jgi:large subunit ribosomal protein L18
MSKTSTFTTKFRRRREGKTNYVKRLAQLKSGKVRAVVRRSTNHMRVQFIAFENGMDRVVAEGTTTELKNYQYTGHTGNVPAAYLAGYLAGKRFLEKGKEAIADIGVYRPPLGTRVFAAVKGIADAGVQIPLDVEAAPKADRLSGKHIEANAAKKASAKDFTKMVSQAKEMINAGVKKK